MSTKNQRKINKFRMKKWIARKGLINALDEEAFNFKLSINIRKEKVDEYLKNNNG